MKTINELLVEIGEDKIDNISTTSYQFKRDIWEHFTGFRDKVCVEFGTHKGQTTRILSFLFKTVYTINNNDNISAKELNKDCDNIVYINFDLYSQQQLLIPEPVDVFFVDAGHEYDQVISDINRIFNMYCNDPCYIIFDDYGADCHVNTVKRAIDEACNMNYIEIIKHIGHVTGFNFGNGKKGGPDRILLDSEGIITKINWR